MLDPLTLLGFDFGTKSIGVAVGQTITQTARPLTAVSMINDEPDWQAIQKLVESWHPNALIVGLPLNMDGTTQPLTHLTKKFMHALEKHTTLPVYSQDERLTTVEARAQLFEQGGYRALNKAAVDAFSAKLILESWMGEHT